VKIETRFIPYSVYSVSRQNQILRNTKHIKKITKLMKIKFFRPKIWPLGPIMGSRGPKIYVLGPKPGISNIPHIWNILNLFFSVFPIFRITSKSIFLRSDSNFNQKFDYEFGTQGLTYNLRNATKRNCILRLKEMEMKAFWAIRP